MVCILYACFFWLGFGFMLSSVGDCTVGARFGSRLYVIKIKKKKSALSTTVSKFCQEKLKVYFRILFVFLRSVTKLCGYSQQMMLIFV